MQKKYGKFYADWRDHQGRRRRKAFKTAAAATAYQRAMFKDAAAKKARPSRRSARSARRGATSGRAKAATTTKP